jgi:hypothetical protein
MPWPDVDAFVTDLCAASASQPREDGFHHPVDALIVRLYKGPAAGRWLTEAFRKLDMQPAVLADLFRGLAVLSSPQDIERCLVVSGFWHPDLGVRDSAVRAIEHWRDQELAQSLRVRAEQEKVAWLAAYMRNVLSDLS